MGIELPLAKRRQQRATDKMSKGVAALHERTCPVDAVPLTAKGQCPVCGRRFSPSTTVETGKKPALTEEEKTKAELREQFYARYDRLLAEREQERQKLADKKEKPTSVVEQAKAFVGPGGRALF